MSGGTERPGSGSDAVVGGGEGTVQAVVVFPLAVCLTTNGFGPNLILFDAVAAERCGHGHSTIVSKETARRYRHVPCTSHIGVRAMIMCLESLPCVCCGPVPTLVFPLVTV